MIEKFYCYVLNKVRESYWITLMIFKLKIKRKKLALNWDMTTIVMKKAVDRYIADENKEIFEMGVGHIGIIAQYIKKIYPSNIISGCDIYEEFVQNSLYNAAFNNLEINICQSDYYKNIDGCFDYLIFNPPYLPLKDKKMDFPHTGYSGIDGMDATRLFLSQSKTYLKSKGIILLGINCYYVPYEKQVSVIHSSGYSIKEVISRRFSTSKVFVLTNNIN